MQGIDLDKLLEAIDVKHLIVDLTNLSFIDSTGLNLLLKIKTNLAASGLACLCCGAGSSVTRMLRITRRDHFFPFFQDIHAARKELGVD